MHAQAAALACVAVNVAASGHGDTTERVTQGMTRVMGTIERPVQLHQIWPRVARELFQHCRQAAP